MPTNRPPTGTSDSHQSCEFRLTARRERVHAAALNCIYVSAEKAVFEANIGILVLVSKMVLSQPEEKKEGSGAGEVRQTKGDLAI